LGFFTFGISEHGDILSESRIQNPETTAVTE
jgi:hypothetical protein